MGFTRLDKATDSSQKNVSIFTDLYSAIEQDQFKVYYQPIVNLATNKILGAEALVRWEHPDRGTILPGEFIALAEETGLIVDIGKHVFRKVFSDYRQWRDKGLPPVKILINFPSIRFFENDFVENVIEIMDEFGLDPHFFIVEIKENVFIINNKKIISELQKLQSAGIQIAVDGYGAGCASIIFLNSFGIDIFKIDGSVIKKITTDRVNEVFSKHIVAIARELNVKLVAEGIEKWEQLSFLRELNCFAGQGGIYSGPVSSEDFRKMLVKRKLKPVLVNNTALKCRKERRRYYRIKFHQMLEARMTIIQIKGERIKAGYTKVLVKDMGPGGLCFFSDLKLPANRCIILQFITQLLDKEIKLYGYPVRRVETGGNLYEYGIEFTIDENERTELIKVLHQVQIKMKNNLLFEEGSFVFDSPTVYFNSKGKYRNTGISGEH